MLKTFAFAGAVAIMASGAVPAFETLSDPGASLRSAPEAAMVVATIRKPTSPGPYNPFPQPPKPKKILA